MYVARAREIHSCTAPPADTFAVELSRLTLDPSAPSSHRTGKETVDEILLDGSITGQFAE